MAHVMQSMTRAQPPLCLLVQNYKLKLTIRTTLIPVLTGRPPPNDLERDILSLPAKFGGITLINPARITDTEFLSSTKITEALKNAILQQEFRYTGEVIAEQLEAKSEIKKMRREQEHQASEELRESLPTPLKRYMDLAWEKGASSWLTSMPIEELGFTLHKGVFWDTLALRYN